MPARHRQKTKKHRNYVASPLDRASQRSISEPPIASPGLKRSRAHVIEISSSSHSHSDSDSDPVPNHRRRSRTITSHSVAEEPEEDPPSSSPAAIAEPVTKKKRKIINSMMPAIWMKKIAGPDLLLMESEKNNKKRGRSGSGGRSASYSGPELGSGDEEDGSDSESGSDAGENSKKKGIGVIRKDFKRNGQPSRLLAEEEQSSEDFLNDQESSDEEVEDIINVWLNAKTITAKEGTAALYRTTGRSGKTAKTKTNKKKAKSKPKQVGAGATNHHKRKSDPDRHRSEKRKKGNDGSSRKLLKAADVQRREQGINLDDSLLFGAQDYDIDTADLAAANDDLIRPLPPRQTNRNIIIPAPAIEVLHRSQRWSHYGKFTPDYQIHPLRSGIRFETSTFIGQGHLVDFLTPFDPTRPTMHRYGTPFGINLNAMMQARSIENLLPALFDAIFDFIVDPANVDIEKEDHCGTALCFIGNYVSETLSRLDEETQQRFATVVLAQLDRLDVRMDASLPGSDDAARLLNSRRMLISWYIIDINERLGELSGAIGTPAGRAEKLERLMSLLMRRLLTYGPERTGSTLKNYMGEREKTEEVISDNSVQCWLCLISLALEETSNFDEEMFWTLFDDEIERFSALGGEVGLRAGERFSYIAMVVCAISQFTPAGLSTPTPRLHAHWPTFLRTLDLIQPEFITRTEESMSRVDLSRADAYLMALFARCLILVERWNWIIDTQDGLLPKLFDILNARRLSDSIIAKGQGDFPPFLPHPSEESYDNWIETTFTIFLKLVTIGAKSLRATPTPENGRQLSKLLIRLSPIRSNPWSRRSTELIRSNSALVNHFSLFLTFVSISPTSAGQRLDQAKRFCDFNDIDHEARRSCIRAAIRFTLIYRKNHLDTKLPLAWLTTIVNQLRTEYAELEKEQRLYRRQQRQLGNVNQRMDNLVPELIPAHRKEEGLKSMARLSLLLHKFLVSIQGVLSWKEDNSDDATYPDVLVLNSGESYSSDHLMPFMKC
jgi:hypothetical protein